MLDKLANTPCFIKDQNKYKFVGYNDQSAKFSFMEVVGDSWSNDDIEIYFPADTEHLWKTYRHCIETFKYTD